MSDSNLFRPILGRQDSGTEMAPLIQTSMATRGWSALLALMFIALATALALLQYKETASARGTIEARTGASMLVAPDAARVAELLVAPGDTVRKGQVLARLNQTRFSAAGESISKVDARHLQQQLSLHKKEYALLQQQQKQNADRLSRQLHHQHERLELTKNETSLLNTQVKLSGNALQALQRLAAKQGVAKARVMQEQLSHLELQRGQQLIARQRRELELLTEDLQQQLYSSKLDYEKQKILIEQRIANLQHRLGVAMVSDDRAVLADQDGIVASIGVAVGDAVTANQSLMTLQSQTQSLQGTVFVPSRIADQLQEGQQLMLRFDGFDYRYYGRFSAEIEQLSKSPLDPRMSQLPVAGIREPVFEVTVSIPTRSGTARNDDPVILPLTTGSAFTADFILAEKRLLAYIFEPLLALRGKVS
ncbi:MAG: HlyD family efflux transporter periplasmic adaptor subunit [Gammaproteobacteria bacterium]